jgi:hypothetical protein
MKLTQLRESHSFVARLVLAGRHGRERCWAVVRGRLTDLVLLLIAIGIAFLFRGWSRHRILGAVEDAGWAWLALVFYLALVFGHGSVRAWSMFRHWKAHHQTITQGVLLRVVAPRGADAAWVQCVAICADGSRHVGRAMAAGTEEGTVFTAHFNSAFPSTGLYPPHGTHTIRWMAKEREADGWIDVASDTFLYAPGDSPNVTTN